MGGQIRIHASKHTILEGQAVHVDFPHLPESPSPEKPYLLEFDVKHKLSGEVGEQVAYTLIRAKGHQTKGIVPADGIIKTYTDNPNEEVTVIVHDNNDHVAKE